ncbi:MAG: hypothetical protein WED33_11160 [Bacteroidia bacterium]
MEKFKDINPAILLVLVFLPVYLLSGFGVTISNDSLTNIEQITAMNLLDRSSHFGFHFLAILSFAFFKLIGISNAVISTQFMLSLISVAGIVALYRIVMIWKSNSNLALIIAIIYGINSNIWRFSVQNEYHVLIPALSLIGIAFWLHGKQFIGAMVLGLAILTSPFAIFSLPLIFIKEVKLNPGVILKSMAGFILVVGAVSLFTYKETIEGNWSYSLVYNYYAKTLSLTNPLRVLSIWVYGYLRAFHVFLPLLVVFLFTCRTSEKRLWYILIATFIIHLPAAIPENRYGAYQMTLYPILAMACGLVIYRVYQYNRLYFALLLGFFVGLNSFIVLQERGYHRSLSEMYSQMQDDSAIEDDALVFMYKATKPFNVLYANRLQGVSVYSGYQEDLTDNLANYELPDYKALIYSGKPVYLIESGVSLPDDYVKELFSKFTAKQGAKAKGIGIKKIKEICPSATFQQIEGYSITLYKVSCDS